MLMPRRDQKPKAPCGWLTHFVKTRVFLVFYGLVFVKSTGQAPSRHLRIAGRHAGSFGKTAKLEFVNGQIFG